MRGSIGISEEHVHYANDDLVIILVNLLIEL